ncbi:MAG: transglycosylase SLT domain-containing protein [Alphaproteobacteria bacterium]
MNLSPHDAAKVWHYYQDSNVVETFEQHRKLIHAFAGKFPLDHIRKRAEEAAFKHTDSNEKVIEYFEFNPVLTAKGLIAYVRALIATNQSDCIHGIIQKYWLELDFSASEMKIFISLAKQFLKKSDYVQKLNAILSQEKHDLANDFLKYVGKEEKEMAKLRLSIQKNDSGAKAAVTKALKNYKTNPGVMFDVIHWYRKKYETATAIEILESIDPKHEAESPNTWWTERNVLARRMMEEKKWQAAYNLIAKHKLTKGEHYANAEWMLGWLELTKLNRPEKAAKRFIELYGRVIMPVSKSRMAFWSAEALITVQEEERAMEFYYEAAALPGTFYGQIAASRLKAMDKSVSGAEVDKHTISSEAQENFDNRFIIQGLKAYGESLPADLQLNLLAFAGTQITTPGEEILITELAHLLGGQYLSVFVSKKVQHLGTVLTTHGYPKLDERLIKDLFSKLPPLIKCIVLGIIRQESNFHESAVSTAKAKGLMQLMDATAASMRKLAPKYGLPSVSGGINDRRVNVTLGTAHILEHLEHYNGYFVLAIAAYNAGSSNVQKWIEIFGDPRETGDWLDWIENIPMGETRNYVHRVLENAMIYAEIFMSGHDFEVIDWVVRPIDYVKKRK